MMNIECVRSLMLIAILYTGPALASDSKEGGSLAKGSELRVYDCAANSLFALDRLSGGTASYARCLELLPVADRGNSIAEVIQAARSLGYEPDARWFPAHRVPEIDGPAVVWLPGLEVRSATDDRPPRVLGHFLVVRPVTADAVQVIDYPAKSPAMIRRSEWAAVLTRKKDERWGVITFRKPGVAPIPAAEVPVVPDPAVLEKVQVGGGCGP